MTKRVLVTGCSSGIGLDAARRLQSEGWQVVATCRRDSDIAARRAEGMECLALELGDPDSVAQLVDDVLATGSLDALVNNAAFALPGAVEDIPRAGLREIFEANLFGTHDLTMRLLPHFRDRGGRVITISSVLGMVAAPWRGPYVATKFALEGLMDTLRLEMRETGVKIVLIEPGPITSRFRRNAIPHFERWVDWQNSARADQYRDSLLKRLYESSGKDRFELPPSAVSDRILAALTAKAPAPRYYVTTPTYMAGLAKRVLPTRALDWFAGRS